jgi:regulator of cell morphogenesis and NO signaling
MNISKNDQVGALVAQNYKTADVFRKHKIDFCCNGNRTIEEACSIKGIDPVSLIGDLKVSLNEPTSPTDYNSWPLDLLAEYIIKRHHRYVEEKIPVLIQYLQKLSKVHGDQHPELKRILQLFTETASELTQHMKKEELVLFPFIRKMAEAERNNTPVATPLFGTVTNPIQMMRYEHNAEGERFSEVAILSNNHMPPSDACNTYKVAYALLQEFETDLTIHIHLENNILFPKAIEMEAHLLEKIAR